MMMMMMIIIIIITIIIMIILPVTYIASENQGLEKNTFLLGWPTFRGYINFKEFFCSISKSGQPQQCHGILFLVP